MHQMTTFAALSLLIWLSVVSNILSGQKLRNLFNSITGVYEEDLPSIRTRLFKAMNAAVRSAITRGKDLTQLNKNGVTPVRIINTCCFHK